MVYVRNDDFLVATRHGADGDFYRLVVSDFLTGNTIEEKLFETNEDAHDYAFEAGYLRTFHGIGGTL